MLFLIFEDLGEEVAADIIVDLLAMRDGAFQLTEHNCAIRAVAERYPEVCAAEERFLSSVLGAAVERRAHIVSGCNACEYAVSFPK